MALLGYNNSILLTCHLRWFQCKSLVTCNTILIFIYSLLLSTDKLISFNTMAYMEGILPKGLYPPCLRMADRALLAGYPPYMGHLTTMSSSQNHLNEYIGRKYHEICSDVIWASPWASCQIRKFEGCSCAGNGGNIFPPPTSKETAS